MPKKWNVIGFFEDTAKLVSFEVEAVSALSAFALAARESDTVTFVAAIPAGAAILFPGESLVDAQTIIEQDDVFPVAPTEESVQPAADRLCPNCGESVDDHPENGCVLASFISVLVDRGEHSEERLKQLHIGANTDALWDDVGPVIDKLGEGAYL